MGVPIGKIICSTNSNDIVHRTISKGDISMGQNIEVSSMLQSCTHTHIIQSIIKSIICVNVYIFIHFNF